MWVLQLLDIWSAFLLQDGELLLAESVMVRHGLGCIALLARGRLSLSCLGLRLVGIVLVCCLILEALSQV